MTRRYITTTRPATRCNRCGHHVSPGGQLSPDGASWCCASCDALEDELTSLLRWLHYYRDTNRTPSLTPAEARTLTAIFHERGVIPARRHAAAGWYPKTNRYATLTQPFDESTYGLLLDAAEHGFLAKLPYPGIEAILRAMDETT